jgi:hypothetical protein
LKKKKKPLQSTRNKLTSGKVS